MFSSKHIEIAFSEERKSSWKFGSQTMRGTEYLYEVADWNFDMRNLWSFAVRVPTSWNKGDYISVVPVKVPNRQCWAGLERRSAQFGRATIGKYRGKAYAKFSVADAEGEGNRKVLNKSNKQSMPTWLRELTPIQKCRLATTLGNDQYALVVAVDPKNHARMIQFYLATRPWVLAKGFDPEAAKAAARRKHLRDSLSTSTTAIRGLNIAVTGHLSWGLRNRVYEWLERRGARIHSEVTSQTNLLIKGAHYLADSRQKVRDAKSHGVKQLSESAFRNQFGLWGLGAA